MTSPMTIQKMVSNTTSSTFTLNMRFVVRKALFKIDGRTDTLQITINTLRKIHYIGRSTRNSKYFVSGSRTKPITRYTKKLLQQSQRLAAHLKQPEPSSFVLYYSYKGSKVLKVLSSWHYVYMKHV